MKAVVWFTFLSLTLSLISCSSGKIHSSDGSAAAVSAPVSVSGKAYRVTAESGSGKFPSTGTFAVVFSSSQSWYTKQGDGVNSRDSFGMYDYSASGAGGIIEVDDSQASQLVYSLTFNTATSGTYFATAIADEASTQSGRFVEQ